MMEGKAKFTVTVKQAAEHYGCKVNRGEIICCPFHDDRHPSMKLNRDYFYCFGCGATGDVIDFVARLFGLSSYEAAKKLAYDFGIDPDKPPAALALKKPYPLARAFRDDEMKPCFVMIFSADTKSSTQTGLFSRPMAA